MDAIKRLVVASLYISLATTHVGGTDREVAAGVIYLGLALIHAFLRPSSTIKPATKDAEEAAGKDKDEGEGEGGPGQGNEDDRDGDDRS